MSISTQQSKGLSDLVAEVQTLVAAIEHSGVQKRADFESLANSQGLTTDALEKGLHCVNAAAIDVAQNLIDTLGSPERSIVAYLVRQPLLLNSLVYRLDLARQDSVSQGIDYGDLAAKCGIDEVALRCYLRYAITSWVLEPEDAVIRQYKAIDALIKWPNSKHAAKTIHASSHNTPFREKSGRNPGDATRASATNKTASQQHLAMGYPWETLCQGAEVVDVVQGLPETLANKALPSNRNVRLMAHDMFATQPVVGADVYMFQWVLHRWLVNHDFEVIEDDEPVMTDSA
ncbi:hypothetical protein KC318_g482 [Hortaea werneckii]|nr:hypothetical protein KC334_g473 [Hortaea werneckii]KAI7027454.1 hypothetical protein KC355_g325 [Hortaea werneckii]KAI7676096.1 hypothetical protein KC318_g482 [Hortaea werneckii]